MGRWCSIFTMLLVFSRSVCAFNDVGHMIVATIAYKQLNETAKKEVDTLAAAFKDFYPNASTFISMAPWADDIRNAIPNLMGSWHFVTQPVDPDHELTRQKAALIYAQDTGNNVVYAHDQWKGTVSKKGAYLFERAFALRFVVHLAGDLHQPLHCSTLYSKFFPQGDEGGNNFTIEPVSAGGQKVTNLHELWDAGVGAFPSISKERTEKDIERVISYADALMKKYPQDHFGDQVDNMVGKLWAQEGYQIAENVVYKNLEPGAKPSYDYIKNGQNVITQRVTLAGYRLGRELNNCLGDYS